MPWYNSPCFMVPRTLLRIMKPANPNKMKYISNWFNFSINNGVKPWEELMVQDGELYCLASRMSIEKYTVNKYIYTHIHMYIHIHYIHICVYIYVRQSKCIYNVYVYRYNWPLNNTDFNCTDPLIGQISFYSKCYNTT